ncbi:MAG TPA: hypothetical protein VHV83_01890 [Armatimonadota bacterium]|nr:hypothetical protein [Armatimonadota bacterium]
MNVKKMIGGLLVVSSMLLGGAAMATANAGSPLGAGVSATSNVSLTILDYCALNIDGDMSILAANGPGEYKSNLVPVNIKSNFDGGTLALSINGTFPVDTTARLTGEQNDGSGTPYELIAPSGASVHPASFNFDHDADWNGELQVITNTTWTDLASSVKGADYYKGIVTLTLSKATE